MSHRASRRQVWHAWPPTGSRRLAPTQTAYGQPLSSFKGALARGTEEDFGAMCSHLSRHASFVLNLVLHHTHQTAMPPSTHAPRPTKHVRKSGIRQAIRRASGSGASTKPACSPRLEARALKNASMPTDVKMRYASSWAGLNGLGESRRSCTPSKICLMVMPGFHASSSFRMLRHTVPDG